MRTDEFWALLGVDKFGRAACEPLNCGAGLAIEDEHGSSEDSYMLVLEDVTAKGFRDFLSALAATGRAETFRRSLTAISSPSLRTATALSIHISPPRSSRQG